MLLTRALAYLVLTLTFMGPVNAASWSRFTDPAGRYTIDVPVSSFTETSAQSGHRSFDEVDGAAVLDIYSGRNLKRLAPSDFIAELSHAPRIQDISYTAKGRTWFAISGHYVRDGSDEADLIYYAKFVFSGDLTRFAAFEISYPTGEKRRMDAVVTRLEKSLRMAH